MGGRFRADAGGAGGASSAQQFITLATLASSVGVASGRVRDSRRTWVSVRGGGNGEANRGGSAASTASEDAFIPAGGARETSWHEPQASCSVEPSFTISLSSQDWVAEPCDNAHDEAPMNSAWTSPSASLQITISGPTKAA